MKQKLLSFILAIVSLIGVLHAQSRQVTGKVTASSDGSPLSGVSVAVVGSTIATQTDDRGDYAIAIPANGTLSFTYVGYTPQRIEVRERSVINVQLAGDAESLDEIVVVAYGTARRSEVTGSIATISSEDLSKRTVTNVSNALAGMAPGISVSSGNGQPGTGANVRLRGFGSMSASSAPLYVVDGAVFDGNIGDLNAEDIESMSILKDATSAALYGSRAGNGVIMITTKKGRGAPRLNASIIQGISERGIKEYETVGIMDYYPTVFQSIKHSRMFPASGTALSEADATQAALNAIRGNLVYNPFTVADNDILTADGQMNPNAGLKYDDFNWFDAIQRTGKRTDANLNFSGSDAKSDYYVSAGYLNDQGYILNSDFKRFNGRVNVNSQLKDWLKAGVNISAASSTGTLAVDASTGNASSFVNPFSFIRGLGPIYPVRAYDQATGAPIIDPTTGEHYYDYGMHPGAVNRPNGASPGRHVIYETILNNRLNTRTVLGGRGFLEIKFLKDFTFTPSVSVDITNRNFDYNWNRRVGDGVSYNGLGADENDLIRSYTFNQVLSYRKSISQHNISALLGHENYDYTFSRRTTTKTGQITSDITEFDNYVTPYSAGGYKHVNRLESYFAKGSYNFNEKYFVDGSVRFDGSSIFQTENRWGTFFSFGGAWALSKESFLSDVSWVNDLRLKTSYGQVGNNNLLDADGNRIYFGYQALYNLGFSNGSLPGTVLYSLANPELTWESSNTFNLGLNFGLFANRLRGEIEFYKRGSDELLMSVPNPLSAAVSSQFRNVGSMYNTGLEVSITGDIIKNTNFTWTLTKNLTTIKNEITRMPSETPTIISGTKRREVGRDYYSFWLRQYAGVDPTDGAALYVPAEGTAAAQIRTVNGVDYVTNQNFAKFDYSGSAIPNLMGSVLNSLSYKDLTFSFLLTYQLGGKMYDSQYAGLMSTNTFGKSYHVDALNAWRTDNTTSDIPRLDQANSANINAASTRWLIDASYLSIRNVNLSYRLPVAWMQKIDMSSARVFFTGENLALFSKRQGLNPTEGFDGTNSTTFLPTRMFSLGLNVSF
ncbi:SusC/RagA family TonB-linked outer membrane protein [Sphingobacterium oryzagri]|uniref:SusC/RagA family TonB-linked outer membrane protein n=1 Tax=Sphingobacterium oryzagri TaxID=3025669 RepID=A0ABY7WI30_9SPHI|nr:SusC/RagA family TonB-linked outer membrane protein [Sphingobacterium sp. KACC 22765]WDF69276.1 SusC/RagA family TonB-linked outer membrane protein [Sphingobacterium sp. KACC 22765]